MITIQSESISNFRNNYNAVLQRLTKGPVLLLQYSDVAGVLLSKEEWNAERIITAIAALPQKFRLFQEGNRTLVGRYAACN